MVKYFKSISIFLFLGLSNAYAYADPGGFISIWQALLAFMGIILFYIFYPIRIIINFLRKFFNKSVKTKFKRK